jgi:transcription elongation factor SPT5
LTHNFSTGDNVEVIEGELMNLLGKILAVDGSKITMQPKHDDLKDPLEFQANELKKYFRQGDHVKVKWSNV